MTRINSESLPFTETDEDYFTGFVVSTIERLLQQAFELNMIDEFTFRRLSIAVSHNSTNDYFLAILEEFIGQGEEHIFSRIIAGAEYIDGLTTDDPIKPRAENKYDSLCEQLQDWKKRDEEIAKNFL